MNESVSMQNLNQEGGQGTGQEDAAKRDFHLSGESQKLINELLVILEPKDGSSPTQKRVVVQYYINRIFSVDAVSETVSLDLYLKVNWIDQKWKGISDDDFQADEKRFEGESWWEPGVEVVNSVSLEKLIEHDEAFWIESPEQGIMAYTQRFIGDISAPMDLVKFPFDTQIIQITFESFHWKLEDMIMFRLERAADQLPPPPGKSWPSLSDNVKLNEYDVLGIKTLEQQNHYEFEDRTYSQINVAVTIKRKYMFYVAKVISILDIIVIMNWVVFFFPADGIADRVNITVTLLLAEVAFQFVTASSLPKISYNTSLDSYLLVCYVYNVLALIESVVVYFVQQNDPDTAQLVDYCMLGIFPGTFIICNLIFFITGLSSFFNKLPKIRPPKSKVHDDASVMSLLGGGRSSKAY